MPNRESTGQIRRFVVNSGKDINAGSEKDTSGVALTLVFIRIQKHLMRLFHAMIKPKKNHKFTEFFHV